MEDSKHVQFHSTEGEYSSLWASSPFGRSRGQSLSHARVAHPLILIDSTSPTCPFPQKSASYEGYLQTRICTVRNEGMLSSTLMEEAKAGLVSNTEFESTKM